MEIKLIQIDHVFCYVEAEDYILREIADAFEFDVPGAKYSPAFKNHHWDGKIHLFNWGRRIFFLGLLKRLGEWAVKNGHTLRLIERPNIEKHHPPSDIDMETGIQAVLSRLGRFFPHTPRDYQLRALRIAIKKGRRILLSPTSSGKSLLMYLLTCYFKDKRFLITVPNANLVRQLQKDFLEYGCDINDIHIIMAGKEKNTQARIVISTWQSIYKQPRDWFRQFTAVIGDECHLYKAKSLRRIMSCLTHANIRIAVSGTLMLSPGHQWLIEGLFGPIDKIETTANLIAAGHVSDLRIDCVVLRYFNEEIEHLSGEYLDEIDFLVQHPKRREFVCNLALALKGNTMVLFDRVEKHGVPLYQMLETMIKQGQKKQRCYLIYGGTLIEQRERLRALMETETDIIAVCSIGCMGTGVNIKNLHNAIIAHPTKAPNRLLQAVGRILRLAKDKDVARWFDIADDLSKKKHPNHTLRHFFERIRIYKEEGFKYRIHTHQLTKD